MIMIGDMNIIDFINACFVTVFIFFRFFAFLISKLTFFKRRQVLIIIFHLEQSLLDIKVILYRQTYISLMGKRVNSETHQSQGILTMKEHIRRASNALQRHIFQKNSLKIRQFLDQNMKNHSISFQTHDKYMDLLRQTRRQAQNKARNLQINKDQDEEEQKQQIHKRQSLQNQFEVMLDKSSQSYQRTYSLFKRLSLLQKYGHLVGLEQQQEEKTDTQELTEEQQIAFLKIKNLYRRYKVSNMYKYSISLRIKKKFIQKLIHKGYLREKNQIVSLTA